MIGKIRKGSGFKGCVNYVLGKEQAALLHAEGILAESNRDIIRSFILQAGMNPDLKKPVGHIALSYSPVDAPKLTDGKMIQLAQEYICPDGPYCVIFCKCRKRDTGAFESAMNELPRKMLLRSHTDYIQFCEGLKNKIAAAWKSGGELQHEEARPSA